MAAYCLTAALVLWGTVVISPLLIPPCGEHPSADFSPLGRLTAWDGQWYAEIATRGYSYDPANSSSVAFFPVYPLLASLLVHSIGVPVQIALLIVSHAALGCALVIFSAYLRLRFPELTIRERLIVVLSLALYPTTFYLGMALTESLFLLLAVLTLYGLERHGSLFGIAVTVAVATATKLVGIVLLVPLVAETWRRSSSWAIALRRFMVVLPLALSGIGAYVIYQARTFGAPLAFVQTQQYWNQRQVPTEAFRMFVDLVTFEPLRAVYDPGCSCYWGDKPPRDVAFLNMMFLNPIYFAVTGILLVVGVHRNWVSRNELLVGGLLLLIPYVLQGYRTCMASQARFASTVFPAHLVLGFVLSRIPLWLSVPLLIASGLLLAVYSSMFGAWYWYY